MGSDNLFFRVRLESKKGPEKQLIRLGQAALLFLGAGKIP